MAKPRFTADGRPLPPNLYPDNKGRAGHWRYRRPDGTFKHFTGTYDDAVAMATRANELRDSTAPAAGPATLEYWYLQYIEWAEQQDPRLPGKKSWYCRKLEMTKMARGFKHIRVAALALKDLEPWWDGLTYDQQHNRRSAFSRWFQWMLAKSAVKSNPFTSRDDLPRLLNKPKPAKARLPLSIDDFWKIYHQAGEMSYEHVQIAMGVSLVTTMRAGDIVALIYAENVIGDQLRRTIGKSAGQRGHSGASHLAWNLDQHVLLRRLVNRARELSMVNLACPHLVSFRSRIKSAGTTKGHRCAVTVNRLSHHFAVVRDATKLYANIPNGRTPPSFHEIRSLAIDRARAAGLEWSRIQELAAHTDERVTREYASNHSPAWQTMDIVFDEKMIGGKFE